MASSATWACQWCQWLEEEKNTLAAKECKLKRYLNWYETEVEWLKWNMNRLQASLQWYEDEFKQLQGNLAWYEEQNSTLQNELEQVKSDTDGLHKNAVKLSQREEVRKKCYEDNLILLQHELDAVKLSQQEEAPKKWYKDNLMQLKHELDQVHNGGWKRDTYHIQRNAPMPEAEPGQPPSSSSLPVAEVSGDPPHCNHGQGTRATEFQVNKYTETNEAPWNFDGFLWSINLPDITAISKANLANGPGFIRSHRVGKNKSGSKFLDSHLAIMCARCKEAFIIDLCDNHIEDSQVVEYINDSLINWFKTERSGRRLRCTLETKLPGSCVIGGGTR